MARFQIRHYKIDRRSSGFVTSYYNWQLGRRCPQGVPSPTDTYLIKFQHKVSDLKQKNLEKFMDVNAYYAYFCPKSIGKYDSLGI
jgi:hypothetical protein